MIYCKECGHEVSSRKICENCYSEERIKIKTDIPITSKIGLIAIGIIITFIIMIVFF